LIAAFDSPPVSFGRAICGDLDAGLRREWLVTNGLGGYASGTLAGVATRRYHGYLVAAMQPPVARTVLVGALHETAIYGDRDYALSAHEFGDGTLSPRGYVYLQSFALDGMLPVWIYALGDALLERRLWMEYGRNIAYVRFQLRRASSPLALTITPLITYRDFHQLSSGQGWQPAIAPADAGCTVRAFEGAQPFTIAAPGARFTPGGAWWWNFRHRDEAARGLDDRSDLFAPGSFHARLQAGESLTLALSAEPDPIPEPDPSLVRAQRRQVELLERAGALAASRLEQQLVLAADQFLVRRDGIPGEPGPGRTVIAGYPWFNDWGRDTMIALPGLALATGRAGEAAQILRTFARFMSGGLCPNNFPDLSGAEPGYNTADATLWFFLAVQAYFSATGDLGLVRDLLPALEESAAAHVNGTRYGVRVDPADGLLYAGEPGVQLTWMDAKVGDWVVTPRTGKPVEINALWYNALRALATLLRAAGRPGAERYEGLADRLLASFRTRFWSATRGYLADVIDGPDGDDWSLRPNQIFALSLPAPLLEGEPAQAVVAAVGRTLLTSYGLRTLAPDDPRYRGIYSGNQASRDGAYHQGPAWSWLLGPFAEAHFRVHGDREAALALLAPLEQHLADAGLGSISELFDGDAPHLPRGCIAQAWGVACALAALRTLGRAR
jgi:predicted glycogen debranching enzyme